MAKQRVEEAIVTSLEDRLQRLTELGGRALRSKLEIAQDARGLVGEALQWDAGCE